MLLKNKIFKAKMIVLNVVSEMIKFMNKKRYKCIHLK